MSTDVDDFLAHYGVKGMKWGIRKEDPGSSSSPPKEKKKLTPAQRNAIIAGGIAVTAGAVIVGTMLTKSYLRNKSIESFMNEVSVNDKLSETVAKGRKFAESFDKTSFDDKDIYIPKGTEFHRVAGYLETSVNAPKYATYIDSDIARYRKSWQTLSATGEKFYKTNFKTLGGSKLASEDSVIRLGQELINSPGIKGSKEFREAILEWGGPRLAGKNPTEAVADFVKYNAGGAWDRSPAKPLFDYMARNGYVGMTDTVDTGMIATHAVVLFNNDIVKTTGSVLTDSQRKSAYNAFINVLSAKYKE
jgi:hypothetical protein